MKKLLLIMMLGLFTLASFGQKRPQADNSLKYSDTWSMHVGGSSDISSTSDSTWTRTISKLSTNKVGVEWTIYLDSISGTSDTVDLFFYYSTHGFEYIIEDTVTWYGTVDTTIVYDDDTTRLGDYHKLYIKERGNDFIFQVDTLLNKFYY